MRKLAMWTWAAVLLLAGPVLAQNPPAVTLSAQEQAYVQAHPVVKMCVDPDWVPFERINEQGQHEGIAADLVQLVAQRVGLRIELLPVKDWEESLRASKSGRCQILSFVNQTPARDVWLIFTQPIFFDPNVFITREEHAFIADPLSLSNEVIALPRGTMVEERIRRDYPNIRVVTTASEQEAIALVEGRQADMSMRSLIVAAYTIKKGGMFNLKISGQIPEYANKLRIAVLKDELLLRDILDKGVRSLTLQEREQIANRHVSIQVQQGIDYVLIWKIVGAALLLIVAALYWNRRLAYFNNRLQRANDEISTLQTATHQALYQVAALLDNSAQGFLSFAADLKVKPQFSQPCVQMFGEHICGADIADLLCTEEAAAALPLRQNLARVFATDDDFKREVLISLLPGLIHCRGLSLRAKYTWLSDGSMMLVLDDVSAELALQEQVRQEQMRLKLVVSVFGERDDVQQTVRDFRRFLAEFGADAHLAAAPPAALYRQVHTFKGVFAQFNFCHLPPALHALEERLASRSASSAASSSASAAHMAAELAALQQALASDIAILSDVLGYAPFSHEEQLLIDAAALRRLEVELELAQLSVPEIRRQLARLRYKSLAEMLAGYPKFCRALAMRLGKEIQAFQIEGDLCLVDTERFGPLVRSLVHVFRNALDHGIESAEERAAVGKNEQGMLSCVLHQTDEHLQIAIADDGRGIDVPTLCAKAAALQLAIPDDALPLIFQDAFSTCAEVSDLSGRGVGLAAVRAELARLGGQVAVESVLGKGTRFIFTLPLLGAA